MYLYIYIEREASWSGYNMDSLEKHLINMDVWFDNDIFCLCTSLLLFIKSYIYIIYIYMYVYIIYIESHWVPLNFIVSPLYHHCCFFIFLFRLVKSLFTILITKCMCIYIYIYILYICICPLFPAYMCRDTCIYCWYANHPSYPILEA